MRLGLEDRAAVAAAMKDVRIHGSSVAHHLRGDIYEVIARAGKRQYRVLHATEGRSDQILLAVHAIVKKTPSIPNREIALANGEFETGDLVVLPLDTYTRFDIS